MIPKFRAWVKETEEMYEVESVGVRNGELWFVIAGPATPKPYEELTEYQPDEIVLMQSTGVLDDNGVEIYEDDIVIADGKRGFVYWKDGGFQVTTRGGLGYHIDEYESLVKIGNTFENPELLEEEGEYHAEPEGMEDYTSDHEEEDDSEITGRDWKPDRDEQNFKEGLDSYLTRSDWD